MKLWAYHSTINLNRNLKKMKLFAYLLFIALLCTTTQGSILSFGKWLISGYEPLPAAEDVKLSKFKGLWYEIFRLPKHHEKCDEGCISIDYKISDDNVLEVATTCVSNDKHTVLSEKTATATPRYDDDNSKFNLCLDGKKPCEDYQIIELDKHYRWALIGSNDRKSLWLISRNSKLDSDVIHNLIEKAKELEFNTNRLVYQMDKCHPGPKFLFLDENTVDEIFKYFHLD